MRKFSTVFIVIGLLAIVAILGLVAGWWGSKPPGKVESGSEASAGQSSSAEQTQAETNNYHPPARRPHTNRTDRASATATNLVANWEDRIDAILTGEEPETEKAKKMIEMFPNLPPDAQEEVAHHISNLTTDDNYAPVAKFLTNTALPEAVLDVFTEDVLNRPNGIKLPALLDIARDPQHPKAGEAKDILELFLEEDLGTDWTRWQARLDKWLKDNPD
jgi:hypothetical protein